MLQLGMRGPLLTADGELEMEGRFWLGLRRVPVQSRMVSLGVQNCRKTCRTDEATKHVKGLAADEIERDRERKHVWTSVD